MRFNSSIILVLLVLFSAFSSGCAPRQGGVNLYYSPSSWEKQCHAAIAVQSFADVRGKNEIGRNQYVQFFPTTGSLAEYVTGAVRKELSARGCTPENVNPDSPFAPAETLEGNILQAYLTQNGWDHRLDLKISIRVVRDGVNVLDKIYEGTYERTTNPGMTAVENLFNQGMSDMLSRMGNDVLIVLSGKEGEQ